MGNDTRSTRPSDVPERPARSESRFYESAADWNRRFTLALLEDVGSEVREDDLATAIAADEHDKPAHRVTADEREAVLARLRHVHLPKLASAGLIDREGDHVVATGYRSIGSDPEFAVDGGERLDRFYEALSNDLRREVLAILQERREEVLTLEELVDAVDGGEVSTDGGTGRPGNRVPISLHHHHLPKLDDAGIVSYDADERRVVYEGHTALRDGLP